MGERPKSLVLVAESKEIFCSGEAVWGPIRGCCGGRRFRICFLLLLLLRLLPTAWRNDSTGDHSMKELGWETMIVQYQNNT